MTKRNTLILVPTGLELEHLDRAGGLEHPGCRVALCGFGPVAAAARTAQLLCEWKPSRVILVGSAGTYDEGRAPVEAVVTGGRVAIDGVGVGGGEGFPQWPGDADTPPVGDTLDLFGDGQDLLLTVCTASSGADQADLRHRRHPDALAEEMEGFGVALAATLAGVPVGIVRGISNRVGDRNLGGWKIKEALIAARARALEILDG